MYIQESQLLTLAETWIHNKFIKGILYEQETNASTSQQMHMSSKSPRSGAAQTTKPELLSYRMCSQTK